MIASLVFILGVVFGSFFNVVIYRVPIMMQREWRMQAREYLEYPPEPIGERFNLLVPSSRCPHCGHRIRAWENIPLVSWLALRGRCSSCRTAISARYPLIELELHSDDRIVDILKEAGVDIARRTVAKYREQLDIAPARARRRGARPTLLARAG